MFIRADEAELRHREGPLDRARRGRVVDDVGAGDQTEEAQPRQHRLHGCQDVLVHVGALTRDGDRQMAREVCGQTLLHDPAIDVGLQDDVDLIDAPVLAEELLCGRQVHDGQPSAERRREPVRGQEPPYGERLGPTGHRDADLGSDSDRVIRREALG